MPSRKGVRYLLKIPGYLTAEVSKSLRRGLASAKYDFCKKIREASSIQGKRALESWGADSDDYIHLAGWMQSMASWLQRCEAFGNLLGMHPNDEVYLKGAAPLMGLLHVWNQTISLVVSDEEPLAA